MICKQPSRISVLLTGQMPRLPMGQKCCQGRLFRNLDPFPFTNCRLRCPCKSLNGLSLDRDVLGIVGTIYAALAIHRIGHNVDTMCLTHNPGLF